MLKFCLKYKALKMTFGRNPVLLQKYNKFFKNVGKNYHSNFEIT